MKKLIIFFFCCMVWTIADAQIEGSSNTTEFNIGSPKKVVVNDTVKKDTLIIQKSDEIEFSIGKKADAQEMTKTLPEIKWLSPESSVTKTSVDQININICIKSAKPILKVSLYQGDKLIEEITSGEQSFRADCDLILTKKATLQAGENNFRVIAINADGSSSSNISVNYNVLIGKYYALIIGVQDYIDESIQDLDEPIKDAQNFYEVLTTDYLFEPENVIFLKNPSKSQIVQTLYQYRSKVTPEDNLLIFYAGHGFWDEGMQTGYWLPADAEKNNPVNWFSNTELRAYIKAITSKHTLLVADACFSGGIFKTRAAFSDAPAAISELMKLPSRKAMTSGAMNVVPDNSVFMEYLVKRLKENQEPFLSTEKLFISFKDAVINNSSISQIPQFGEIKEAGDEGGDFIFMRR